MKKYKNENIFQIKFYFQIINFNDFNILFILMNDILLDRDSTMNRSGFEDDSMIYEEENTKNKNKNLSNSINITLTDDNISSGRQQILAPDILNPNGSSINENYMCNDCIRDALNSFLLRRFWRGALSSDRRTAGKGAGGHCR
jgi:hypothetical protein